VRRQRGHDERYVRVPVPVLIALLAVFAIACGSAAPSTSESPRAAPAIPDGVRWAPIVDSHVHLAYYPVGDRLLAHGVAAVVDLGAPESTLGASHPLTVIAAGPMVTRPNGYPLNAWGANGYGVGCAELACVTETIDRLAAKGASIIKLPLDPGGLPPPFVAAAIEHAHAKRLRVAVHALTAEAAARGAAAGADLLAHTPAERLDTKTVEAWRGRAVISTLAAFEAPAAIANLRDLRAAGVTVLYGTDLGNLRIDGPSRDEIALLREAGLDDAAIVDAMTTAPIAYWKLSFGDTYLVLATDPRSDATALLSPRAVVVNGQLVK
jgi:hypothetical protein